MGVVFNVRTKAALDRNGNPSRVKYKGVDPISLAYGLYLGDSCDTKSETFKAFFLMTGFVAGTGEVVSPSELRNSPRMKSISLEDFPFSKKFSISETLLNTLSVGQEYWFLYTSSATSNLIENKMVTYESLDLICIADAPGADAIKSLLPLFKLKFQQNS